MNPLITVVTPSYNNSKTIFGAIDSVLMQSYPNIQYIVCDDASGDFDGEAIIEYIRAKNTGNIVDLIVTRNDSNLGITKNLNRALSQANGKYLFNVAADDEFFDESVLTQWVERFESTRADVITAKRAVYDENLATHLYDAPTATEIAVIKDSTPRELFEKMRGYNLIFGCCTARTKKSFDLMGGYDEKYPLIEDYPSNLKLLRLGVCIEFWDRAVVKYRSGGISSQGGLSEKYLQISDSIFKNEVLPYCQNPSEAKADYSAWKNEAIWLREKKSFESAHNDKNTACKRLKYICFMAVKHPILSIKRFIRTKLWTSNK